MIITITGTPCTGKTTIAKALAKRLKISYLDVNHVIQEKRLRESYEQKRQTYIVDEKKLSKELIKIAKKEKNLIIDSHLSHFMPKKHVDVCIVTTADVKILKKRLEKRKYSKNKIKENLDAEIFEICHTEAQDQGHKIILLDTTKNSLNKCLMLLIYEINKNRR